MERICPSKRDAAHACKDCGKPLPTSKDIVAQVCRQIRLCRYCYKWKICVPRVKPDRSQAIVEESLREVYEDEPFDCANTPDWEWHEKAIRSTE